MKKTIVAASLALSALFAANTAEAAPITLDFEGFSAGTVIDDQYDGVRISAYSNRTKGWSYRPSTDRINADEDYATVYPSASKGGADSDLEPFNRKGKYVGFKNVGYKQNPDQDKRIMAGNILIVQEMDSSGRADCATGICSKPDDDGAGGIIEMVFEQSIDLLGFNYFDIENPKSAQQEFFEVYTRDPLTLAWAQLVLPKNGGTGGDDKGRIYNDQSTSTIDALRFVFASSGAIDNIQYSISEVPLPGAIPLFLTGLAGIALVRKKKQANNA